MSGESMTSMDTREFIFFEHARATAFNMFTALLCQPEDCLMANNGLFESLRSALEIAYPEGIAHVERMEGALRQNTAQKLLIEYTRLFIGPFKAPVPPYSSLYLGTDTLMSDATVWVMNCYKKSGREFDQNIKDVPDHVAVETEFMYYLIHSEMSKLDAGKRDECLSLWEDQHVFFDRHYKKWVPHFCAKVAIETSSEYYKAISECLNSFIENVDIPAFPN